MTTPNSESPDGGNGITFFDGEAFRRALEALLGSVERYSRREFRELGWNPERVNRDYSNLVNDPVVVDQINALAALLPPDWNPGEAAAIKAFLGQSDGSAARKMEQLLQDLPFRMGQVATYQEMVVRRGAGDAEALGWRDVAQERLRQAISDGLLVVPDHTAMSAELPAEADNHLAGPDPRVVGQALAKIEILVGSHALLEGAIKRFLQKPSRSKHEARVNLDDLVRKVTELGNVGRYETILSGLVDAHQRNPRVFAASLTSVEQLSKEARIELAKQAKDLRNPGSVAQAQNQQPSVDNTGLILGPKSHEVRREIATLAGIRYREPKGNVAQAAVQPAPSPRFSRGAPSGGASG